MRHKILAAAIFGVFLNLMFSVAPAFAYYTNMPASVVIGQTNFISRTANQGIAASAVTLNSPQYLHFDGTRLFVSDLSNRRLLIYNQVPTSNNISADVVVGQANFNSTSNNQGGSAAANTLTLTQGVTKTNDGKLIVGDFNNNRVLIFNQTPTANNASADVVIGQTSMSGTSSGISQTQLSGLADIYYDPQSGKLFIADTNNHRVLIYNQVPTTNGAAADIVIGQVDFTHNGSNQGGSAGPNTLSGPRSMIVANGKLIVTDLNNHRVLIYNQIPTANNTSADIVIGQVGFTQISSNQGGSVGPNTLFNPRSTAFDGKRLFIAEQGNNRILIFNQIPTTNNASADTAIGQVDLTHGSANQGGSSAAANTLSTPVNMVFANGRLLVGDSNNNRVLIFNDDSTAPGLSVNPPQSAENSSIKFAGSATTISNYWIQTVQYMVNGGGFNGATATDGAFDNQSENFFFTFDPKSNNNKDEGYTVQIQSRTSNYDLADHLFYFQPFNLNTPDDRSFISKALPSFSFSVNKQQTQLKENLSKYQLLIKRSGNDWKTFVDNIPVDYASVKDSVDNLQKSNLATNGNGTYEDKKMLVVYSNNNSTMTVTPKAVDDQGNSSSLTFDQNGKLLTNGVYEWKVQAIDKNGHTQETETREFVVGSSQFSNGSNWFPLQINSISGLGRVYLSTISPQLIKPKYRIQTSNPIFKGIATVNSTVQLDLTNQTCLTKGEDSCIQTFTANSNASSQFTLTTPANTLKSGSIYQAQFSVSQNGLFNALPPFQITR